jgi:hypothetical protein
MLLRTTPITEKQRRLIFQSMDPPGDLDAPYIPTQAQLMELRAVANARYGFEASQGRGEASSLRIFEPVPQATTSPWSRPWLDICRFLVHEIQRLVSFP